MLKVPDHTTRRSERTWSKRAGVGVCTRSVCIKDIHQYRGEYRDKQAYMQGHTDIKQMCGMSVVMNTLGQTGGQTRVYKQG